MMASLDPDVRRAQLVRRYHSRQVVLHVECFYNQLCEPLDETLTQPPEDGEDTLKDPLAVLLGVNINRILKFQGDPPVYRMDTGRGLITLGTIGETYRQATFRKAVRAAANVVIPKVSGPVWRDLVQAIQRRCEDVGAGDPSHPAQETRTWLRRYLACRGVTGEEEWQNAARLGFPFLRGGQILIFLRDLRGWLEVKQGRDLDPRVLRQVGAERKLVNVRTGKARTTRSVWVLPEEFQPPRRD